METEETTIPYPMCFRCGLLADEIEYIVEAAEDEEVTPEEWVKDQEGTYNRVSGQFCCDSCYIALGCPSSPSGWQAP